jgi:hypothetical protein
MNNNGGWCWYQDERTLFDSTTGCVLTASVGEEHGFGGSNTNGDLSVTSFNINTGERTTYLLRNNFDPNDHAVPALWQRPDGRYVAAYSKHNGTGNSYFRISANPHDITSWESEFAFDWDTASGLSASATYNNLLYLSDEGTGEKGRLYNVARYAERSPIVSYSDDWGETWSYAGPLTLPEIPNDSYSNGYVKFTSNGVDRIDFITTEAHPRHFNNSIYHGYIQGGQIFNTTGDVIDSNLYNSTASAPEDYTKIFASSPEDGVNDANEYHRAWTTELERDSAGNVYALFTTRYGTELVNPNDPLYPVGYSQPGNADHRLFYAKLDIETSQWEYTELCKMGIPLYPREQDYTGLGAIDPKDPSTIYVSTAIHPQTGVSTAHREIYKGKTHDGGGTWQWTAITENSTAENLRPIIPAGDNTNTAVLWLRGRFPHFRDYDQTVVGILDRPNQKLGLTHYVDADLSNTTLADGSLLYTTSSSIQGPSDDRWHKRTGYGNEGSVLASNELGGEDAPVLKTTLTDIADGTYDVFAYFWSNYNSTWLIEAGFTEDNMVLCEKQGAQQAEADEFDDTVLISSDLTLGLYRLYVGRTDVGDGSISVFIDDLANVSSSSQRVWYDGLGYAKVIDVPPGDANRDGKVDSSDATILAGNWQATNADWSMGDFNGDGVVDASDATILAGNWQAGTGSAVPEPGTLSLIATLLLTLAFIRRLDFNRS